MLFIGRSGASSVVLGSLRDSSSAATEPATEPLRSRNAACAVSHGRKPCGDMFAAGSSAVNTWTPRPVLAACKRDVERRTGCVRRDRALVERDGDVGIAQQAGSNATTLQFMLHASRQRQHDIFLRQRRSDGCSNIGAAVRGIDQHQEAWRCRLPRLWQRAFARQLGLAVAALPGGGGGGAGAPVMMMVLPPSAKLAISGAVPVTSSSARPSCSEKLTPVISGSL